MWQVLIILKVGGLKENFVLFLEVARSIQISRPGTIDMAYLNIVNRLMLLRPCTRRRGNNNLTPSQFILSTLIYKKPVSLFRNYFFCSF